MFHRILPLPLLFLPFFGPASTAHAQENAKYLLADAACRQEKGTTNAMENAVNVLESATNAMENAVNALGSAAKTPGNTANAHGKSAENMRGNAENAQKSVANTLESTANAHGKSTENAQRRTVGRTWIFRIGGNALYDSYLSPLDYNGPSAGLSMENERTARWGNGNVITFLRLDVDGTWAENQAKNADFYDGNVDFHFGWQYNWQLSPNWRLRAGGIAGINTGGTYSTRNGNNPAQGRAAFDVRAMVVADYAFRMFGKGCSARISAESPLAGLMFSPQYGQSYYEIFSLGHYDGNVRFTYPGNVPSLRLDATLRFPVRKAYIVAGYGADIRQSRVNHLDRHAWNHCFLIGFTRRLSF